MTGQHAVAASRPPNNPLLAFATPHSIWLSRAATVLQTFAIPFALYFKPVIVLVALSWLVYRASQVLNKPLEELASLLGFDVPVEPIVDLAGIKADGATVHWSLPEKTKHKSSFKFEIHLNGALIDTFAAHETAATIYGLQPGCWYVVRVALMSNVDFTSRSAPLRFRTRPAADGDFFFPPPDGNETEADDAHVPVPRARPYKGLKDITPATADTVPMVRDGSTGLGPKRSLTGARRPSPAAINVEKHDPPADESEAPEGAETIQQLTEKLDQLRRETEEAERLAREEEEEESRLKEDLLKQRDELRSESTENDKASRNLKREVNTLERQNTAAQNERNKQERMLQQRKQERQKLKEDMIRWEQDAAQMRSDLDSIRQKKDEMLQKAEVEKEALRAKQTEEASFVKSLDEEVKEKSREIKDLERAMKNNSPVGTGETEPNLVQQLQQDAEEKRLWDMQYADLQRHYTLAVQSLEKARQQYQEQQSFLEQLRAQRRREEAVQYASPPSTQERLPRRGDSQRSRRAQSGHSSSDSPRLATFPMTSAPFVPSVTSTMSPFTSAPFLNIHNGMTVPGPTDELAVSDEDRDRLTGGALMSPGAGAEYLPADLFGEGDSFIQPLPGLGALPGLGGLPAATNPAIQDAGPASPASAVSSRSPSVFASPQASQQNLHHLGSPDNVLDADRRSIRSVRSNRATSGSGPGSRFSGMFGIKQRAKTNPADEPPALGKAQSHSLPRTDQGIPGIDSNTRKRNSSISGTAFAFGNDGTFDVPPPPPPATSRGSRAFRSLFTRADKSDGWPTSFTSFGRRPASPRPGSTHSNELPRPSFDSSRWAVGADAWPSSDAASGTRGSPLAFGTSAGWNAPPSQQPRNFGSRYPSRRPSAQYGSSGPPEDIPEDEDYDAFGPERAQELGAIGTRPPAGSGRADEALSTEVAPRLNPNAKSFTGWLQNSMKLSKSKESASSSGTPNMDKGEWDESPPNSRKSKDTRDARSMTTTESSVAESSRNSADLARTPSYSNSDAAAPSPLLTGNSVGKESFMQKLSRKSSSSKFTLPTFKREKNKMDTGLNTPTSAPTEEEDSAELSASASSLQAHRESKDVNKGSVRNWSSVLKLGRKKEGNETPSVSGMSLASGTEDNEDED